MRAESPWNSLLEIERCVVDGRTAAYLCAGSGPTLLFVHGWAVTPFVYKKALQLAVEAGYRVVAPFLPGSGPSEPIENFWSKPSEVADWIERFLLKTNEKGPSIVAGHSLGGGLATNYVFAFPGQVERLFLLSSVGGSASTKVEARSARSLWEWSVSLPLDLMMSNVPSGQLASMVGGGVIQLVKDPIGFLKLSRLAREYCICQELRDISSRRIKVFVVGANKDRVITRSSTLRLAQCASVDPIWIEGTHSWMTSHPGSFAELLATWR